MAISLDIKRKSGFKIEIIFKTIRLDEVIKERRPGPCPNGRN